MGGTLVELFHDRALGLPPLNSTLAQRMMARTHIYGALLGKLGRPAVDIERLASILVQFSYLVVEQPWIKEIDVNPLLVSADSITALDAHVILYPPDTDPAALPRLAIRPYPVQYEQPWVTKQGLMVNIRPIRPEDEPLLVTFHEGLSEESVYLRFFQSLKLSQRVAHERLTRVSFIDYDREMALVVTYTPDDGDKAIIAAGRLSKTRHGDAAEFAMLISDAYQRQGIGSELLRRLIAIGRDEGVARIVAYMLPSNTGMITVSERLGFTFSYEDTLLKAVLELSVDP
jgi:acetyltransferase